MFQTFLPIFPEDLTLINKSLAFQKRDGVVYYFNGMMPIYSHRADDLAAFHLIASQMFVLGNAPQMELVRAFGISVISVKRLVKVYREKGPAGFFEKRKTRGVAVLTPDVVAAIQELLDEGESVGVIARDLNLKSDTFKKAIKAGRLRPPPKKKQRV
ncbi:hypothetical protein JXQ70_02005 [bacterium]|nr:hypothetical protein [bacterium]